MKVCVFIILTLSSLPRVAAERTPPLVPYLGTVLNELSGVVEALPTRLQDELINFNKMRRCTRLIIDTLRHQKQPYDLTFVPEVSKVLLCVPIPGTEDDMYRYVDALGDK
ncbi:Ras-specific guanine nucleotide-releasing factor 2 [Geodia barretti]|uniref:Ras-specific guanine nucleotide-releasing factor 2 n=1 Tax=Geodia barretti TaxID=519541 RepID=A0AA35S5G6_GEOBA|nr:Ras-specific guanine nucleotide-releasing factor 2 [Geodia barretti]